MIRQSFRLLLMVLCIATVAQASEQVTIPSLKFQSEGVTISEWRVLGPLQADYGKPALDSDFFARIGASESACSTAGSEELCARIDPDPRLVSNLEWKDSTNLTMLFDREPPSKLLEAALYMSSGIATQASKDAWLMLGSPTPGKAWLNGELLTSWGLPVGQNLYDAAIPVRLSRGRNLLLLKIVYDGDPRFEVVPVRIAARIETSALAAARTGLEGADSLLSSPIVASGKPIELIAPAVPPAVRMRAKVRSYAGVEVDSRAVKPHDMIGPLEVDNGLYRISVEVEGVRREQAFYVGTIAGAFDELAARAKSVAASCDQRSSIHLGALLRRLEMFAQQGGNQSVKPSGKGPDKPSLAEQKATKKGKPLGDGADKTESEKWRAANMKKPLEAIRDIADALLLLEKKKEAFRHLPGVHFRGYRSRIDDAILQYQILVPSSYRPEGPGVPLVIIPIAPFTAYRPFIESIGVDYSPHYWEPIVESLGFAVLWPGYRTRPYGNPTDVALIDEVLEALQEDYKVDVSRLYLYGDCAGGLTAAEMAIRHPGRYAGLILKEPVLHRVKNRFREREEYRRFPDYMRWLRETDPLEELAAISELPIWISHDDTDPGHGPLSDSVEFVTRSRSAGNQPIFERLRPQRLTKGTGLREWQDYIRKQMAWLLTHRSMNPVTLDAIDQPTNGPIMRILSERFIVVKGTQGSDIERKAASGWHTDFCDTWFQSSFGVASCRTSDDADLSLREEKESHLVLVGNSRTNAVWARLAEDLPFTIAESSVSVAGRKWDGEGLALQAWFPHPEIEGRKVIFIGAAGLVKAQVGTMELAMDGWFDFAIWSVRAGKPYLLHAGRHSPEISTAEASR